jgi:D-3-phosphoglycerate dehydrogenase
MIQKSVASSAAKGGLKAVLFEAIHSSAVEALRQAGYTRVVAHDKALTGDELLAAIADAHFVGVRSGTHLTAEVLQHAQRLAAIGCFCIGTNQVDLKQAMRLGIPVFNAPFSNTRSRHLLH